MSDPLLEKIKAYLQTEFKPSKIILIVSRAKGHASTKSDYDLLVVTSINFGSKWQAFDKARTELFENLKIQADVWVYSEKDFEDWSNEFGSIPETAINTGIEL